MISKRIDPSLKLMGSPLLICFMCIAASALLIKLGLPGIQSKINKATETKKIRTTLEQRLTILKEFKAGILDDHSDITYTVFPDKNPGALALSQIKQITAEDQISVKSIEFTPAGELKNKINKTDILYQLESNDLTSTIRFLSKLQNTAPISTVDEVTVNTETGIVKTTLKSSVYWAALPTGLPAITEPINDLTAEEKNILNQVYSYRLPQFSILEPSSGSNDRVNPFN